MTDRCPGCGLALAPFAGPTDAYGGASAACFRLYGDVLAREFSEPAWFASHQLSAHAYMAQHPSSSSRAAVQSVWVHLGALQLLLERDAAADVVARAMSRLTATQPTYEWLDPPASRGDITVREVAAARDADEHAKLTRRWADAVWQAWREHHDAIRALAATALSSRSRGGSL
jgi:hypothetical protein